MSVTQLLIGIDIGTTGTRCMIFDTKGYCLASAYREYALERPRMGWVEQSVPDMLETTALTCREAIASPNVDAGLIASVGLSTQQASTCACTSSGELLRPMISWQDTRSQKQYEAIKELLPLPQYQAIAGVPLMPIWTLAKVLWLRENEPDIYEKAEKWPLLQDLALRFFGAPGLFFDNSQAVSYGMWDVANNDWSKELTELAGLRPADFGTPVNAGTCVGTVSKTAADLTGIPAGTPLCVGGGDQACGPVAMGASKPGTAAVTLGTTGFVSLSSLTPRSDLSAFFTVNSAAPNHWMIQAATLSAAGSYRWFRDAFKDIENVTDNLSFKRLDDIAAKTPAGANGLLFLPYLNTAGSPHFNQEARGAFIGMVLDHGLGSFARAVMEGVTFEIKDNLQAFATSGLEYTRVRAGGGATHSDLWNQIQADIYGLPVEVLRENETGALGAAILGGVGAGVFNTIEEGESAMVQVKQTVSPDAQRHTLYQEVHEVYAGAYEALAQSTFPQIARLQLR
jgi:xylulokinase